MPNFDGSFILIQPLYNMLQKACTCLAQDLTLASRSLNSSATRNFVQQRFRWTAKKTSNLHITGPLWKKSPQNGTVMRKVDVLWHHICEVNACHFCFCHYCVCSWVCPVSYTTCVDTLGPKPSGRHCAEDNFKRIFLNENVRISIKIWLKFIPKAPADNIPALILIMAPIRRQAIIWSNDG